MMSRLTKMQWAERQGHEKGSRFAKDYGYGEYAKAFMVEAMAKGSDRFNRVMFGGVGGERESLAWENAFQMAWEDEKGAEFNG